MNIEFYPKSFSFLPPFLHSFTVLNMVQHALYHYWCVFLPSKCVFVFHLFIPEVIHLYKIPSFRGNGTVPQRRPTAWLGRARCPGRGRRPPGRCPNAGPNCLGWGRCDFHDFDMILMVLFLLLWCVMWFTNVNEWNIWFYNSTILHPYWENDDLIIWFNPIFWSKIAYIYIYSHPGLHVWALISTIRTHHTPFGECSKQYSKEQTTSKYVGSLQTRDSWQRMQTNIHQARQQSPNAIKKKQDLTLACFIFANLSTIKSQEATYKHADSETPPWSLFEGYPTNCHVGQRYDGWQWVEQKW